MTVDAAPVIIAGAGLAGLTAALAFAQKGWPVRVIERASHLDEAGAGIQLSSNATRILARLEVLDALRPFSTQPEAISIREAATLRQIASVPLGARAQARWGAPYLAIHRADLQRALLEHVRSVPCIELVTGMSLTGATPERQGVDVQIESASGQRTDKAALLIGADGIHSAARRIVDPTSATRATGYIAWRRIVEQGDADITAVLSSTEIVTLVHQSFHLVSYPVRDGNAWNLVLVTRSVASATPNRGQKDGIRRMLASARRSLAALGDGDWTPWPISEVSARRWTLGGRIALIGDAAHAMSPFAAQGAAMGIEDAASLAAIVGSPGAGIAPALARFQALRQPRVTRVAARGRFNRFAWHAAGPIAFARNLVLAARPFDRLADDLDWIYGHDAGNQPRVD